MKDILLVFSQMLKYPDGQFFDHLDQLKLLVDSFDNPQLSSLTADIYGYFKEYSVYGLEELYSQTFDWNPRNCLYAGYYLFGESYFRSSFLSNLLDNFKEHAYPYLDNELPDHFSILLDFSAKCLTGPDRKKFIESVVVTALDKFLNLSVKEEDETDEPKKIAFSTVKPYYNLIQLLFQFLSSYMSEQIIITTM